MKSLLSAVREAVSSEVSIAATTFCFISTSRSETVSPAVAETSEIDCARCRLIFTAPRAPMSARCPCAMAQTAALSLAFAIIRPVFTRFWTLASSSLVLFRFCSAVRADLFVWTLIVITLS